MAALPHAAAPGAVLADLRSVADCDAALDALAVFIAQAERRLGAVKRRSANEPAGWRATLTAELRIAKLTLPRMQERRADLKREERQVQHAAAAETTRSARDTRYRTLLAIVREIAPEVMSRVDRIAQERFPELYEGGEFSR